MNSNLFLLLLNPINICKMIDISLADICKSLVLSVVL